MLTTEQIDAIRDRLELITEPINKFLISDICRRIKEAGQATSTAEYQARRARALKLTPKQLAEFLAKEVPKESKEYKELYRQVSDLVYKQTYRHIGMNPQDEWESLAAVADIFSGMAEQGLFNIVQTLGMVDVYGNTLPLRDVYINNSDYAFRKVQAGAQSYQEAVKDAIANIADYGVRFIDYESGRRDSLDVAVRRNVFGGMGLMVEQVQNKAHDEAGCDGWEVSAHEACAKDHEPYQGRQFTDNEFMKLNGTPENPGILKRRFSTLNCKHVAFPIILGVNQPQYTKEQLEDMKKRNEDGVTYQGKHYTSYEATQMQRKLERTIRKQRRKVLAYESAGLDSSAIKTRLTALNARYSDFSQAAGIKTQPQRLEVLGYGPKQELLMPSLKNKEYTGLAAKIGDANVPLHEAPKDFGVIDISNADTITNLFNEFAEHYKDAELEHALVITNEGKLYLCQGTATGVWPDYDLGESLKGASVIHNHPISETEYSFSKVDISLFEEYNLNMLEGVDSKYRYKLTNNKYDIDDLTYEWHNEEFMRHLQTIIECKSKGIGYRRFKNDED